MNALIKLRFGIDLNPCPNFPLHLDFQLLVDMLSELRKGNVYQEFVIVAGTSARKELEKLNDFLNLARKFSGLASTDVLKGSFVLHDMKVIGGVYIGGLHAEPEADVMWMVSSSIATRSHRNVGYSSGECLSVRLRCTERVGEQNG